MAKKFSTSTGKRQPQVKSKVVRLRDKENLSWAAIAEALEVAPRTVRRLYDEAKGAGAHFDSRPLSGGRNRKAETTEEA